MTNLNLKFSTLSLAIGLAISAPLALVNTAEATIAASHVYHNHMPNFWPYYDTSSYATTPNGGAIRYTYDGQVLKLKLDPPSNYTYFLTDGSPMPHDDLVTYYSHHAKQGAYGSWPAATARANSERHPLSQTQVTMSAAVINNVQSFAELGLLNFGLGWANDWKSTVGSVKTTNGFNALDPIHFTGHHSMGPLVGPQYFLKDLIYQNVTLQQDYFLGDKFKSSKGFFPTELGFSERLIPTLKKLGVEWSVMGNNHFSRALRDYPFSVSDPAFDTVISPPNRADLQNTSEVGDWVTLNMAHEKQNVVNKFPFAAIPHWVQYVNPETGEVSKLAGIPVDQNGSWLEGWEGNATPENSKLFDFEKFAGDRTMYFVIAHDGDNSQGRAGSFDTWLNSGNEYATDGVVGMGIQEYLKAHPIPADDVQHVQDGSWIDTRDSSSDPTWYHWHIPMGVWKGQFADFNEAMGTEFENPTNFEGIPFGHAVSMEYGYHYLERNFALLQAAINYAETAEQIWLDAHPNYWSPKTDAEKQVTYEGNQLNPYMMSYPVKGDEANDYKGGANPAELGWYFLISSIDSGFGYYDENTDDNVKPTLGFNQSLFFTQPYVEKNLAKDKTGPSMWWVQRYPYNPGSANASKAEGWTVTHADNEFAIYTYAYDVSGIKDVKVMVRPHKDKRMSATDIAPRVYDPKKFAGQPNVDVDQVGEWKAYATKKRDLTPNIDGVDWQTFDAAKLQKVVKAQKIGDTYYAYISDYRDQLVDYYMEATDNLGNVTKSEIQSVYVGAGRYKKTAEGYVEDVEGDVEGTHMFFTDSNNPIVRYKNVTVYAKPKDTAVGSVFIDSKYGENTWSHASMSKIGDTGYFKQTVKYQDDADCADIRIRNNGATGAYPSDAGQCLTEGEYTITEGGVFTKGRPDIKLGTAVYFKPTTTQDKVCMHYRALPAKGSTGWTTAPGVEMTKGPDGWFSTEILVDSSKTGFEYLFNDCAGNWFRSSTGNNFVRNEISDFNVNGTSVNNGSPFTTSTNKAPVVKLNPSSAVTIKKGASIVLDASGSTDADGSIKSFLWSNGETTSKITVSPSVTTVYEVVVTDNEGAKSSGKITVNVEDGVKPVENKLPLAIIDVLETKSSQDGTIGLDGSRSYDPDGSIVAYEWKDAQGKVVSTTKSTNVSGDGLTTYTLTVTDNKGATASTSQEVLIAKPVIDATVNGLTVSLKGQALLANNTPMSGLEYEWKLGDGTTVTGAQVTHTYKASGTYDVRLVIKKSCSLTAPDSYCPNVGAYKDLVVKDEPLPVVKALITNGAQGQVAPGTKVELDASASQNAAKYAWTTGETTAKITVAPAVDTKYCVTVTGAKGGSDTACTVVEVKENSGVTPEPFILKANVVSNRFDNRIEEGQSITFNASGSAVVANPACTSEYAYCAPAHAWLASNPVSLEYKWSTGETTNSITVNPDESTTYELELTPVNTSSEYKLPQAIKTVVNVEVVPAEVDAKPVAIVTPNNVTTTVGQSKVFYGAESSDDKGIASYLWTVDGVVQAETNNKFTYTPTEEGTHKVVLTVTDTAGQTSDAVALVTVKAKENNSKLNADFKFDGSLIISPDTKLTFDAGVTTSDKKIVSYLWFVNNKPQTSGGASLSVDFSVPGTYAVKLQVKDSAGNISEKVGEIVVAMSPEKEYVDKVTGETVKVQPSFSVTANGISGDLNLEKVFDSAQILLGKVLDIVKRSHVQVTPQNYTAMVKYYVYKTEGTDNTNASVSGKLCRFTDNNTPDCNSTTGADYVSFDANMTANFNFAQSGNYEIKVVGTDKESGLTSVSTIPVTVQSLKDIASNGNTTNPGGQVTNPNGGGAFDPLSLLMLGGLAAFMRRRKAQK